VIRQIFEPRIVGKNLGLYPLATMIAMYAGYRMMGALGLLGGPVLLNIVKVVLEADRGVAEQSMTSAMAQAQPVLVQEVEDGSQPKAQKPKPDMPKADKPKADGELILPDGKQKPFKVRAKK
jgi:hypothetical protein